MKKEWFVSIVIVTHGDFGRVLLKSVELILGKQKNVFTLGIKQGDNIEVLKTKLEKILKRNKKGGNETIVLVDLFGASPFNITLSLLKNYDLKCLTGVNMPMLIEILSFREECDMDTLVKRGYKVGIDGIKSIDASLLKMNKARR